VSDVEARLQLLTTEEEAKQVAKTSDTMDTLLLMSAKDAEILELKRQLEDAEAMIAQLKAAGPARPPPPMAASGPSEEELTAALADAKAATERAERAEARAEEADKALTKTQAKLNAVSAFSPVPGRAAPSVTEPLRAQRYECRAAGEHTLHRSRTA
jgi:hypothetical protein